MLPLPTSRSYERFCCLRLESIWLQLVVDCRVFSAMLRVLGVHSTSRSCMNCRYTTGPKATQQAMPTPSYGLEKLTEPTLFFPDACRRGAHTRKCSVRHSRCGKQYGNFNSVSRQSYERLADRFRLGLKVDVLVEVFQGRFTFRSGFGRGLPVQLCSVIFSHLFVCCGTAHVITISCCSSG